MSEYERTAKEVIDYLCSVRWDLARIAVPSKLLKEVLLSTDGELSVQGQLYEIRAKALGAGVYRITLTQKEQKA